MSSLNQQPEPSIPVSQIPSVPAFLRGHWKTAVPLPLFDGNPFEWMSFYTEYDLSTRAYNISNETNVQRLWEALKGVPFAMVYSLFQQRWPADEIMDVLHQNFDHVSRFFSSLLQRVYDAAGDTSGGPLIQLHRFCQALELLIHNTAMYGVANVIYNVSLTRFIARSLPFWFYSVWERFYVSDGNLYLLHHYTRELIGVFTQLTPVQPPVPPPVQPDIAPVAVPPEQ